MPTDGLNISTGIGQGDAQVIDFGKSNYGAELYKMRNAGNKAKDERESGVYKDIGKVNIDGIFFKHQPVFAQKQAELKQWTKDNIDALRKGDADATIEFQNKLTKLGTDIGLSKNVNQGYKEMFGTWAKDQNKYRDNVPTYMDSFTGYDPQTDQFEVPDMSQLKPQTDLGSDFKTNVLPLLEKANTKGEVSWNNPDGSVSTKKTSELTNEDATNILTGRLTDPHIYEQTVYDYSKENPTNPNPSNEDLHNFYYDKYVKPFVKKETFLTKTEGSKGAGLSVGYGTAETKDMYYKLENPDARKSGKKSDIIFGKVGGTALPVNQFQNSKGEIVKGQPTGKIKDIGGELTLELRVTDKDEDTGETTTNTTAVPLSLNRFNKQKFEGEYGGVDIQKLYNDPKFIGTGDKSASDKSVKSNTPPKESPSEWNKKWSALKKGESMVGLDGKTYTKK